MLKAQLDLKACSSLVKYRCQNLSQSPEMPSLFGNISVVVAVQDGGRKTSNSCPQSYINVTATSLAVFQRATNAAL